MHYVYILKCGDGEYYTGKTWNLKKRFGQHERGEVLSTKSRLPVKIVFYCSFPTEQLAILFEKYLKSSSGRSFRNKHFLQKTV